MSYYLINLNQFDDVTNDNVFIIKCLLILMLIKEFKDIKHNFNQDFEFLEE